MVTAFERFMDAVDRRCTQPGRNDYKAGFMESFLQGLSETNPQVAGHLIAAAEMLNKWSDEDEARSRVPEVDIKM